MAILAREQGLICRPIGDVVILMPPLASTVEQLEDMVRIVGESIQRATEEEGISKIYAQLFYNDLCLSIL